MDAHRAPRQRKHTTTLDGSPTQHCVCVCVQTGQERSARFPQPTDAEGRAGLPVVAVVHLDAGDLVVALELVARVALEGHGVPGLPAVPAAAAVHGHARVAARGRHGACGGGKRGESVLVGWLASVGWQPHHAPGVNTLGGGVHTCDALANQRTQVKGLLLHHHQVWPYPVAKVTHVHARAHTHTRAHAHIHDKRDMDESETFRTSRSSGVSTQMYGG